MSEDKEAFGMTPHGNAEAAAPAFPVRLLYLSFNEAIVFSNAGNVSFFNELGQNTMMR